MRKDLKQPLLDENTGRVKNVLLVDNDGNIKDSLLVDRITATDPDDRMPPVDSHKELKREEIALLKRWSNSGDMPRSSS